MIHLTNVNHLSADMKNGMVSLMSTVNLGFS